MKQARNTKEQSAEPLERGKREEYQADELSRPHSLLQLQRLAGNRAVLHLMDSRGLQTKLRISEPADEHEHEADRAAEQVLHLSQAPSGVVQRKCADCSPGAKCAACEEEEGKVQRKPKHASVVLSTTPQIQRAPRNGDSGAPDGASEPATATAGFLIVDDDAATVAPGQMRKSDFLEQLRSTVCATADEALKEANQTTEGCPYIEKWLGYYAEQEPAHIERALRKYAPEAVMATSARDYIPAVSNRVRRGVATWARTGEVPDLPPELAGMLPGAGGSLGAIAGMIGGAVAGIGSAIGGAVSAAAGAVGGAFSSICKALFKRKEGSAKETDEPQEIQGRLSGGQPLDGGAQSRMGAAFGHDFSAVRVHTDSSAAVLSDQLNARAFTVGSDIAFSAGEYQPGTLIGDALIAHELAHVVQQGGNGSSSPQSKSEDGDVGLENEADVAAVGAVSSMWLGEQGAIGDLGRKALPRMRSGLRLQKCSGCTKSEVKSPADVAANKKQACPVDKEVEKQKSEIVSTFNLSNVTQTGEACWTVKDLVKMKGALARIPKEQRDAISGISLVRVKAIVDCAASGPQGCFRQKVDATGKRSDSIEISDDAMALDKDFEESSKNYRMDLSGAKIATLPSQDVLLHEVGHAVETAKERTAEAVRIPAEKEVVKTQDDFKSIVEEIARAKPPSFGLDFSRNAAEAAYQKALVKASAKVKTMVDAIGEPSNSTAKEISKMAKVFKGTLPEARSSVADLKKKKAALPSGSSVAMSEVDGPIETQMAAAERLVKAIDARLASQEKLDPAEKAEAQAKAKIKFKFKKDTIVLDITRRLAELVALVDLKGIDVKAGFAGHVAENWPNHPEELYAELYQWSISEPGGLKAFDSEIAKFYENPIGPKGGRIGQVDSWIAKHTSK